MNFSTDLEPEVGRRPYLAPSGAFFIERKIMSYTVNFKEVETIGLETSPVAEVLAGLRANEARYFWNKYKQEYVVYTPEEKPEILPSSKRSWQSGTWFFLTVRSMSLSLR